MEEQLVQTDVLVVGGGIAGLMAAIRARELGARVVVAEKENTLRSGAGGMGNDHFRCYIPEYHGTDVKAIIEAYFLSQVGGGGMKHMDYINLWLEKSGEMVKLWDSWGIPMKYGGHYHFAGHTFPGYPHISLKYGGENQKPVLTREARKRGVEIVNRVMVFDLLTDGKGVIGAIGIDTREERLIKFQAKSVILATGGTSRLYPGLTPGYLLNIGQCPSCTGDGRAMAYRAGAELVNTEMGGKHVGPKYFARFGQATWVGVLRDPQGKPVGAFVSKPDTEWGDPAMESNKSIFADYRRAGRGPIYMDCAGLSDDDYQYMKYWLVQEGNTTLLDYMDAEGIDPRRNPIEFATYTLASAGGVHYDVKSETSIKGLYAAGDESPISISVVSGAAVHGPIAGENAANYARQADASPLEQVAQAKDKLEEGKKLLNDIRSREDGSGWREFNIALQQVLNDYAEPPKSEGLLMQGLNHLRRVKAKAYATLGAKNQHELVRCLEVLNLLELGELVFVGSLERKETRGLFVRSDYPLPLPMPRLLTVRQADGKPATRWEEVRHSRTGISRSEPW